MPDPEIPVGVQALLREQIESYEQLEILLLLRARPDRSWTAAAVATELGLSEPIAEAELRFLCGERLLEIRVGVEQVSFRYGPESPERAALITALGEAYKQSRFDVMGLMSANAIERLRVRVMTRVADAFLFTRKMK